MTLGEIFSDAIHYPFSDMTKFIIVGIIALLAGLSNLLTSFEIDGAAIGFIAGIVSLIFSLILSGYGVDVIKKGIQHSNEIPDLDIRTNLINGIKVIIIEIVYYIIPIIITVVLMLITGTLGASVDHVAAGLGIGMILAIILFIAFSIFATIALARFAAYDNDLSEALSMGDVLEDVKNIGILNIVAYVIILIIVIAVAALIAGILGLIPYVGLIIGAILLGGFIALFANRTLGLLYATA